MWSVLASAGPRRRSYGNGCADLLHGGHGPRAPRRRQPLRGGARGAAGDAGAPAVASGARRTTVLRVTRIRRCCCSRSACVCLACRHIVERRQTGPARRFRSTTVRGPHAGLASCERAAACRRSTEPFVDARRPPYEAATLPGAASRGAL